MKKNLLIAALMLGTAFAGFSQKKNRTTAISFAKKNKFVKAKPFIDKAINHESTKGDAKTWSWKAAIYAGIAGMKTPEAKEIQESTDLAAEVMDAMKKTKALDKKGYYKTELRAIAGLMYNASLNGGIDAYNSKDYKKAFAMFSASQEYADILGMVDTIGAYNAGMSAGLIENYDAALLNYKKCIKHGYGGADVYLKLADTYKKLDKPEEAKKTLAEAKEKYKGDPSIVLNEAQIYLDAKEYDKAKASIENALKNDPNNFQLQFASAIIYSNMELYDESINAYKKALEINPKMDELKSDIVLAQYNKVYSINAKINELGISDADIKKAEVLKAERDAYIKEILPSIEARYKDDSSARMKKILNNLYVISGQPEKRMK